jgi:hypothetical protein
MSYLHRHRATVLQRSQGRPDPCRGATEGSPSAVGLNPADSSRAARPAELELGPRRKSRRPLDRSPGTESCCRAADSFVHLSRSHREAPAGQPLVGTMDSPIVTQLFRQLFRHHPACQSRRNLATLATALRDVRRQRLQAQQLRHAGLHQHHQHRSYVSRARGGSGGNKPQAEANWQQRSDIFQHDMTDEFKKYPLVTAVDLRGRTERPRRVKMLMRDFIDGESSIASSGEID